ncbi:MAG: SGNH/GDSL hydrolase family protein [Abditibacteriota bacterium]|nr:SGNH/GDSL hydrolase family protein [Abditibacteriota bacterium]
MAKNRRPPRILFLGNSFTYFHDLYKEVARLTGGETAQNVKGGAALAEQLNPETELGKNARLLLQQKWDYVVLQEQSSKPMTNREAFLDSAAGLCLLVREAGAKPVFYATWPYQKGSEKLASTGRSYTEMFVALTEAYHEAARQNDALIADVGTAFYNSQETLLEPDSFHPNKAGTALAAEIISGVIMKDRK